MGGRTKGWSGYGWRGNISGVNRGDVKKSISYRPQVPAFDTIEQKNEIVKTVRKKVERKKFSGSGGVIMKMKL